MNQCEDLRPVGKTNEWTHYFTKAGNYETYLDAWKDNKVIKRSVFYVKAKESGKDFLHMNWADMVVLVSDDDEQGNPERYILHVERLIVL